LKPIHKKSVNFISFFVRSNFISNFTIDKKSIIWKFKTRREGDLDRKAFFGNIRREANVALSRIFDKVEEVSKVSALKLKISNYKGKIKDHKKAIGGFVVSHKDKFSEFPEIIEFVNKITFLEEQIELKREQIIVLQEKEQSKEKVEEEEDTSSQ